METRRGNGRPGRNRAERRRASSLAMVLAVPALLSGCTDLLVDGPPQELGNVLVEIGVTVEEADGGITVNGNPAITHPPIDRALWLDRFERFDLGGFPELDYHQDARRSVSWRVTLTHSWPPEQRGDTAILRYRDHGDVTLGGHAMDKHTGLPDVGQAGRPVRFENFIRYSLPTRVVVEWMDGGTTTFVELPVQADLAAGRPVTVETTGSDDALPVHATFAAFRPTRLTAVENDRDLDLATGGVPVIDVGQPLVFAFDAPLDPNQSFIILHPMLPHAQPGARAAFIRLRSPTRRAVIPPHVLLELVAQASTRTPYRAIVVEVQVSEDAFAGTLTPEGDSPEAFALPFVQRGETSIHLYLDRR